jgi:general secretion pathway protein M
MISTANLVEAWRDLDSRSRLQCGYALIALLAVVMGWSALASRTSELERKRAAREAVLKELLPLKAAYRSAKMTSDQQVGKMATLRPDDSLVRIIEEIGIKGKGVKIAPLKGEERNGVIEDAADVRIEGLTANETVNLVYRLEKGSRPIQVKKANLRVRFDDPSHFDLAMTTVLLKPAPGQAR